MEVDSIIAKVEIKSIEVAPSTNEAATKIVHLPTLSTIAEIEEGIENLQPGDGIGVVLMVE
jgi:hypothetical protein